MNKLILAVLLMTVALAGSYLAFRDKPLTALRNAPQLPQQSEKLDYVTVGGEGVHNPGRLRFREGLTLMGAITGAGGFDQFASPRFAILKRGEITTRYKLRDLGRDGSNNPPVQVGDVITLE